MSCVCPGINRDTLAQMGLASLLLHMGRLSLNSDGQCKATEAYRMLRGSRTMPASPKSQDSHVTPSLPTMEVQFSSHERWKGRGHMKWTLVPSAFNLGPLPPLGEKLLGLYHFSTA